MGDNRWGARNVRDGHKVWSIDNAYIRGFEDVNDGVCGAASLCHSSGSLGVAWTCVTRIVIYFGDCPMVLSV